MIHDDEFRERRSRATAAAADRGLGGLVVFSRGGAAADQYGDVAYLAGHHTPICQLQDTPYWSGRGYTAVVLPVDGPAVLITDNGDHALTPQSADEVRFTVRVPETVAEVMQETGMVGADVGLVAREVLLHHHFLMLEEALDVSMTWRPADDILETLRRVKSPAELELLREAADVGCHWMNAIMDAVEPGRTEGECVAAGLNYLSTQDAKPYDVAVASGPESARYGGDGLPVWNTERKLERGDLIHVDAWGPVRRYYTDIMRSTVVGGSPTAEQRDLLDGAVEFIDYIVAGIAPGATVGSLHARGMEWLVEHDFLSAPDSGPSNAMQLQFPAFGHGLGMGLDTPYILADEPTVIETGMAIAVEGMLTRTGLGGVGNEENVIVTDDGYELLTAACPPRRW